MKRFIVLLVLLVAAYSASAVTLTTFRYYTFTLDRSLNPQVESPDSGVKVVLYRDDGTTPIDSGTTNGHGLWATTKLYRPQNSTYQRVLISKTGIASEWHRFLVGAVDTTADTIWVVPLRTRANIGDTTRTLTVTLVNADGTPASGVTVQARVSAPAKGLGGSLLSPATDYGISWDVSDAGGLAELDVLKGSYFELWIAGVRRFAYSEMDSSKDLGNIVLKP